MSDVAMDREMAPKRKRMMDMVMALGGLKEESTIPLSKVSEELAKLKEEISPLMDSILAFPGEYFKEFVIAIEKSNLIDKISDQGILSEAVIQIEAAVTDMPIDSLETLYGKLKEAQNKFVTAEDTDVSESTVDLESTLNQIPELITQVETIISEQETAAKAAADAAREELESLTKALSDILSDINSDPVESLDALQKIGTKTRYGPFLRTAAQVKRGIRDERITGPLIKELVTKNVIIELRRGIIMFILDKMGSKTVVQISDLTGHPGEAIQSAIISMMKRGEIEMVGLDGDAPVLSRVLGKAPNTTLVTKVIIQQLRGMRNSVEGPLLELVDESLKRLESIYERLQILGEYDEVSLSEPVSEIRESMDLATEAVLSSQSDEGADELRLLISAGLEAFARFRLKITLEKGPNLVSGFNVYGEKLDPEQYEQIMDSYLESEVERGTLLILIRDFGAMTAHDLAEKTKIPQDRIFRHLLRMKRDELLTTAGETHGYVLYDVPRTPNEAEVTIQTVSGIALQLATARKDLEEIFGDLKPEYIGRLANSLEVMSRSRDKLAKLDVSGIIVGEANLQWVEVKIKSAVLMAYRTRTKLPSTRPKVTLEELLDVDVPTVLEEYRDQMGYAPLLGFGTINWDESKCLGCKSCEIACPEDAIFLKPRIEVPKFFEFSDESLEQLPVNKSLFYRTVQGLATTRPTQDIVLEQETPGFGSVDVDLWLCVACRTCVRRCPGPEEGALELDLKWSLPAVVKQLASEP